MGKMKELGLLDCEDRQSIEENFERIKKGGGVSVQSDWNQNNPESPDYVKNRPFYETDPEPLLIEFDGNIVDGMEVLEGEGMAFVKVSTDPLTAEELFGGEFTLYMGGDVLSTTVTDEMIQDSTNHGMPIIMIDQYIVSVLESISMEGMTFTKGLWVLCIPGQMYVQSLSFPSVVKSKVIPISEKFFNADDIVAQGLGYWNGKLNDWNYFINRPFGASEEQEHWPRLTWDGDVSGKEVVAVSVDESGDGLYFCKVYDDISNYQNSLFSGVLDGFVGVGFYLGNLQDNTSHVVLNDSNDPHRCVYQYPSSPGGSKYCLLGETALSPINHLMTAGAISKNSIDTRWGFHLNKGIYFSFKKENGEITDFAEEILFYRVIEIPDTYMQREIVLDRFILNSSTSGSSKKFIVTVDDNGTLTATETDPMYDAFIGV